MKVTLITARLRFETPGGVSGTEVDAGANGSELPIRREPAAPGARSGKPALPGTTIAGSLRAHCAASDSRLDALFGDSPEQLAEKARRAEDDAARERATPSAIQVLGTVLHGDVETTWHTRNSLDRERGAARTHHLHKVEVLPAGTEFDVVLRWDNADPALRDRFLSVLEQWHPVLGRGVTRGAGRCRLVGYGTAEYDLTTADGLLGWLQQVDSYPEPARTPPERHQPEFALDADLSIVDAVHCGTEQEQEQTGKKNVLKAVRHGGELVVPGSTLKGVLRSRAEYICRVLGLGACSDQRCGTCRPCLLFGFAGNESAQRGRIVVDDAVIQEPEVQLRPHVAIDRFTGGARPEALYEHEVVAAGWFPIRVRWLGAESGQDARLLHAVLADLHDRYAGIGARTTAGYGTVAVRECRTGPFELSELATALREPATKGDE